MKKKNVLFFMIYGKGEGILNLLLTHKICENDLLNSSEDALK